MAGAGRIILFSFFLITGASVVSSVKARAFEYKTASGTYKALYFAFAFFINASRQRLVFHTLRYLKSLFALLTFVFVCRHKIISPYLVHLPGEPYGSPGRWTRVFNSYFLNNLFTLSTKDAYIGLTLPLHALSNSFKSLFCSELRCVGVSTATFTSWSPAP